MTTNAATEDLVSYLEQVTTFFKPPMCPLERFILECGTNFQGAKRPKGLRKQQDKMCFRNATRLSLERKLRYVEGFATSLIPTFHAWCLAEDGTVIDPTWRYPERSAYRGFVIPRATLLKQLVKTKCYGVLGTDFIDVALIEELRRFHRLKIDE